MAEAVLQSDLMLSIGVTLLLVSILAFMSAWVEDRLSPFGLALVLIGLGLIGAAQYLHPQGYGLGDLPLAFINVFAHYIY